MAKQESSHQRAVVKYQNRRRKEGCCRTCGERCRKKKNGRGFYLLCDTHREMDRLRKKPVNK